MSKLSHCIKIIMLLQTHQMITSKEIAKILNITPRNVKAYIEYLKLAGVPIEGMTGRKGGYFLADSFYFKPPNIDDVEYSALLLAEKLLMQNVGFPLKNELKTAMAKIKSVIGDVVTDELPIPADEFVFSFGKVDKRDGLSRTLTIVCMAIKQRKRLEILYYTASKDERKLRQVDPYAVVHREGSWYLIGFCHLRNQIRTFKLVRIEHIEILNTSFVYPAEFSISDYMSNIFSIIQGEKYNVEIRFFHPASIWVREKTWLPTQQIEDLGDGSILFKATVKGLIDIKRWVMSFGKLAVVQKPKELVKNIQNELKELNDLYF
ncbi:MAG: WYL domain-containing protein [Clostridiales bacterium]|jgi:predicted DNA-binding transcriptional regulator YafY|nr:WYL domain-containing protein [Clostridiales bacterium]